MTAKPAHRILIVDDERVIADTHALVFRMQGYEAKVAYDAETALVLLQSLAADVLVSDIMLPRYGWSDSGRFVHATYPNCRILFMSGHPATADIIRDAEDRSQVFEEMAKPFHLTELLARVTQLLLQTSSER